MLLHDGDAVDRCPSLLQETEQVVQELLPLGVCVQFVELLELLHPVPVVW